MDTHLVTPLLISLLVGWSIYRRARRSIGRQPLRTTRLWMRAAILAVVGGILIVISSTHAALIEALAGGIVVGVVLGFVGLRHTKFETTDQGSFYTPHTYIGLFVLTLFVARIAYRVVTIYLTPQAIGEPGNPFDQYQRSPLTLGVVGVLIGYYVVFNLGVLRLSRSAATPGPGVSA